MVAAPAPAGNEGLVLPGQPLLFPPRAPLPQPGIGAYTRGSQLLASVVGHQRPGEGTIQGLPSRFVVPQPSSVVLGRVTRVTPRQATLSILVVDGRPCSSGDWRSCGFANHAAGEDPSGSGGDFTGVVRQQDVRATEKDKVRLADSFRPGDIVRATVISLGDARSYYLSTASNHLGVVYALPCPDPAELQVPAAADLQPLEPISWQEMRNPITGAIEKRKVAKPE
ncbi:hypothetical protein FA10DRAFT_265237 [Acaromyces ingoldii]|uniref:Exosome complex component CSL4 C-terminal domain-containing protein n=1 Tax=Acaromyces ingoldii TaxID=215250 RepID=A0A316YPR9_9BASI|nr:hypothetical protein FA10DRAFT_265237 [Acaromyces ingoldii]PWN91377.1 hypothetical protein FA10DRAFT_265237 [Acaromyces ingoldii]